MKKNREISVRDLENIIFGSGMKEKGDDSKVNIEKHYVGLEHDDLPTLTFMDIEFGMAFSYILDQVHIQEIMTLEDGEDLTFVDNQNKTVTCTRDKNFVIFDSPEHSTLIRVPFEKFTIEGEPLSPEEIEKAWHRNRQRLFRTEEAEDEFDGVNSSVLEDEFEDEFEDDEEDPEWLEEQNDPEKVFEYNLMETLVRNADFDSIATFDEVGVMTNNAGLVVRLNNMESESGQELKGPFEFQVTIVRKR